MLQTTTCPHCSSSQSIDISDPKASIDCVYCSKTFCIAEGAGSQNPTAQTVPVIQKELSGSLLNQVIGGCRILSKLGQGGMGIVYKAHHLTLDIPVALKTLILQGDASDNKDTIERFMREARSAAKLRHPNIVGVLNVGEDRGTHFLIMEYVEGQNLLKRLKETGPLPVAEAISIIKQICQALEVALKYHIVHRDIKPENILIDPEGIAKLVDLGLAKNSIEDLGLTNSGMAMGTPHYMSPEQAEDAKNVDHQGDIYSLGCTLYHLLIGKVPYEGNSVYQVLDRHVHDPVPDPRQENPALPEGLVRILLKMMAKKKSERYLTATAVLKDLEFLSQPPQKTELLSQPSPVPLVPKNLPKLSELPTASIPPKKVSSMASLETLPLKTAPAKKKVVLSVKLKKTKNPDQIIILLTILFAILFIAFGFFMLQSNPNKNNSTEELAKNETAELPPKKNPLINATPTNTTNATVEKDPVLEKEFVPEKEPVTKEELVPEKEPVTKEELVPEKEPVTKEELVPEKEPVTKEELVPEKEPVTKEELVPEKEPVTKEELVPEKEPDPKKTNLTKKEKDQLQKLAKDLFFLFPLYEEGKPLTHRPVKGYTHPKFPNIVGEISGRLLYLDDETNYGGKEVIFGNEPEMGIKIFSLQKDKKSTKDLDLGEKSSWSISIWFKTSNGDGRMLGRGHDKWTRGFFLGIGFPDSPGSISCGVAAGDGDGRRSTYIATQDAYADNLWHHVVFLYHSGKYLALFVDGKPAPIQKYERYGVSSAGEVREHKLMISGMNLPITPDQVGQPMIIGNTTKDPNGLNKYQTWRGSLRDLLFWKNYILSDEEIGFLYRLGGTRNVGNALDPYLKK